MHIFRNDPKGHSQTGIGMGEFHGLSSKDVIPGCSSDTVAYVIITLKWFLSSKHAVLLK